MPTTTKVENVQKQDTIQLTFTVESIEELGLGVLIRFTDGNWVALESDFLVNIH